jgi:[acyl-carrier-protein] S-malonyltransferase
VIAFIFPGQGSQKVGMGSELAAAYPVARRTFDEADAAFSRDSVDAVRLSELCFQGPEDRLMLTEHTQPAIVAMSTAACRVLAEHGISPSFVAGHSLGEYSAHVAAGTMDFSDAVATVRRRGRFMQEAVPVGTGAMAAILGSDLETVTRACAEAAAGEVVSPANINGPGQIVIAGNAGAVQRACERARTLGAKRALPLAVSAPFHCALMKPAEDRLAPELRALRVNDPRVPVVANVDAEAKRDAGGAIEALVRQVSAPVQWEAVVRRLASEGVTTYVEVGPGTVLSGLVKKILEGLSRRSPQAKAEARILSFGSPADLAAVVAACST